MRTIEIALNVNAQVQVEVDDPVNDTPNIQIEACVDDFTSAVCLALSQPVSLGAVEVDLGPMVRSVEISSFTDITNTKSD